MGDVGSWSAGEWTEIWRLFSQHIQSDLQFADIPGLIHLVPQVLSSIDGSDGGPGWKIVRMTLEEVAFARTKIYNASVLVPQVELLGWTQCMVNGSAAAGWDVLRQACTGQWTLPLVADEETVAP